MQGLQIKVLPHSRPTGPRDTTAGYRSHYTKSYEIVPVATNSTSTGSSFGTIDFGNNRGFPKAQFFFPRNNSLHARALGQEGWIF